MKDHQRLEQYISLYVRAAHQDSAAELAAEVAREAEHTRHLSTADQMWAVARRCRVAALELRALAEANRSWGRARPSRT